MFCMRCCLFVAHALKKLKFPLSNLALVEMLFHTPKLKQIWLACARRNANQWQRPILRLIVAVRYNALCIKMPWGHCHLHQARQTRPYKIHCRSVKLAAQCKRLLTGVFFVYTISLNDIMKRYCGRNGRNAHAQKIARWIDRIHVL